MRDPFLSELRDFLLYPGGLKLYPLREAARPPKKSQKRKTSEIHIPQKELETEDGHATAKDGYLN